MSDWANFIVAGLIALVFGGAYAVLTVAMFVAWWEAK